MEGETKITIVEKVKDPRRVAQGKKTCSYFQRGKGKEGR